MKTARLRPYLPVAKMPKHDQTGFAVAMLDADAVHDRIHDEQSPPPCLIDRLFLPGAVIANLDSQHFIDHLNAYGDQGGAAEPGMLDGVGYCFVHGQNDGMHIVSAGVS